MLSLATSNLKTNSENKLISNESNVSDDTSYCYINNYNKDKIVHINLLTISNMQSILHLSNIQIIDTIAISHNTVYSQEVIQTTNVVAIDSVIIRIGNKTKATKVGVIKDNIVNKYS